MRTNRPKRDAISPEVFSGVQSSNPFFLVEKKQTKTHKKSPRAETPCRKVFVQDAWITLLFSFPAASSTSAAAAPAALAPASAAVNLRPCEVHDLGFRLVWNRVVHYSYLESPPLPEHGKTQLTQQPISTNGNLLMQHFECLWPMCVKLVAHRPKKLVHSISSTIHYWKFCALLQTYYCLNYLSIYTCYEHDFSDPKTLWSSKIQNQIPTTTPRLPRFEGIFCGRSRGSHRHTEGLWKTWFVWCFLQQLNFFLVFFRQCHSRHNAPEWSNLPKYMCQTTVCLCVLY